MTISTSAHLNFRGDAREALAYYQSVFGGQVTVTTYADIDAVEDPDHADDVAFGRMDAPTGVTLMAYDVQPSKPYDAGRNAFYLTLNADTRDEIEPLWDALADEATTVLTPLGPAPFAALYGMLTDRYGTTWILGANT